MNTIHEYRQAIHSLASKLRDCVAKLVTAKAVEANAANAAIQADKAKDAAVEASAKAAPELVSDLSAVAAAKIEEVKEAAKAVEAAKAAREEAEKAVPITEAILDTARAEGAKASNRFISAMKSEDEALGIQMLLSDCKVHDPRYCLKAKRRLQTRLRAFRGEFGLRKQKRRRRAARRKAERRAARKEAKAKILQEVVQ